TGRSGFGWAASVAPPETQTADDIRVSVHSLNVLSMTMFGLQRATCQGLAHVRHSLLRANNQARAASRLIACGAVGCRRAGRGWWRDRFLRLPPCVSGRT